MPSIQDGTTVVTFEPDEWIVVRYCYANLGRSGPGSVLITGGEMSPQAFEDTRTMLQRWHAGTKTRRLNANIGHGQGAASAALYDLIKKKWKLPHLKDFDRGQVLFVGTRRVGPVEEHAAAAAAVLTLEQVPTVAAAVGKLEQVFSASAQPHAVTVTLDP